MKKLQLATLITLIGLSITSYAQENEHWLKDFDKAKEIAAKEHRPILMSFAGSDWCKPCIKLTREVFETPEFQDYAKDHLVLLLLDFPRLKKNALPKEQVKHNEKMAEKYNHDGSFPLVVLVDAEGKVIDKTGYQAGGPDNFIAYLNKTLP